MRLCARHAIGMSILLLALTPASAQIIVGVSAPISTGFGKEVADGARLAATEINEHGGLLGQKIELKIEDDACNPPLAAQKTQKLIEYDKAVVIGIPARVRPSLHGPWQRREKH